MRKLLLIMFVVRITCAQHSVLTANYDNGRTNANPNETILTPSNVNSRQFGKIAPLAVDGQIYAQPLYAAGVSVGGVSKNLVFVATMHNSVYAFDAGALCDAAPIWSVNLGPSLPTSVISFREINPEVGILSTPVIDPASNTLYAVAEIYENGAAVFRLHALDLSNGREKMNGPVTIEADVSGQGDGSAGGQIALDPLQHLQRPGLLLANGSVYLGFGSVRDRSPFHGWILAYDASDLSKQKAVFNVTPEGGQGGVWQSGRGLAADAAGNVYTVSGNGDYDGFVNFGESFIKLTPDLRVIDWFAPADWRDMSDVDLDLGSLGPILVPGTGAVIGGDKANNLYVVDSHNMGHLGTAGTANPQVFPALAGGGFFNLAVWPRDPDPMLYMVEEGDWTGSFRLVDGAVQSTPVSQTTVTSDWPFQGMAISANGNDNGILWMTAGDHEFANPPGVLLAYDALDLTHLLWTSEMNPDRDGVGIFAKFANPTVVNGLVFVPTFSNQLTVYGLLPKQGRACEVSPTRGGVRGRATASPK